MQTIKENNTETNYESGGSFHTVIGKTTYEVAIFFNKDSKVSLEEKLKRLIQQDVKTETSESFHSAPPGLRGADVKSIVSVWMAVILDN